VLDQDELDVALAEPGAVERAQEEDVGVGALRDRDPLALEVRHGGDAGVGSGHERGPLGLAVDVDGADRVAVDPAQEGRGPGGGAEVDGARVEELERLVRARALHPAHRDSERSQLLLEPALLFDDQAHGIVVGPVERDLGGQVGGADGARGERAGGRGER
jgi:hypothetical protein